MIYYYKLSKINDDNSKNINFFAQKHPDYVFYSNVPKEKWKNNTIITWTSPRFTHTSSLHSFRVLLSGQVINALKRITQKEAFIRVI